MVGLHGHSRSRKVKHGGKAAPLRAAKHRQQPAQQRIHPGAAQQKPPRAHRQQHAQVIGLYPGQHRRPFSAAYHPHSRAKLRAPGTP